MTGYLHVCFVEHDYDEGVEDECGQDDDGHDEPIDGTRQLGRPGPHATFNQVRSQFDSVGYLKPRISVKKCVCHNSQIYNEYQTQSAKVLAVQ